MNTTDTLALGTSDAAAIVTTALAAAEPRIIDPDGRFVALITPPEAAYHLVDLDAERQKTAGRPHRKLGSVTVRDAGSFVGYLGKHSTADTEVYADVERLAILGVINAHGRDQAGYGDHRVTLALRKTPAWKAWEALNGKQLPQASFAEHLEDRLVDIVRPTAGELLEVVQTFQAATKVAFESSTRLASGEVQLVYREDVAATAGRKGQLTIPETFELALVPFEGSPAYKVTARLRYRIGDGRLTLGYALDRPEDVLEAAFRDVCQDVASDIDPTPLLIGWPA